MNIEEEAKSLLVGSSVSKYSEKICWTYQPGLTNDSYPIDLYIHNLRDGRWIIQSGCEEELMSSFEECLRTCMNKAIEYDAGSISRRLLTDKGFNTLFEISQ